MGLFTKRKDKDGKGGTLASESVAVKTNNGAVQLPPLDVDKAATKIESHYRGILGRKKTTGLKAHREAAPVEDTGLLAIFAKCLPCLAPPAPASTA